MNKHELVLAISEGIADKIITDGEVTNENIFMVMFPNLEIIGYIYVPEKKIVVKLYPEDAAHDFDYDWWKSPYKIG